MYKRLVLLGMVGLLAFVRGYEMPPAMAFASVDQTEPSAALGDFSLTPAGPLPPMLPIDPPSAGNVDGADTVLPTPTTTPPPDSTPAAPAAHAGQAEPALGPTQDSSLSAQNVAPPTANPSDNVAGSQGTHAGQAELSNTSGLAP